MGWVGWVRVSFRRVCGFFGVAVWRCGGVLIWPCVVARYILRRWVGLGLLVWRCCCGRVPVVRYKDGWVSVPSESSRSWYDVVRTAPWREPHRDPGI